MTRRVFILLIVSTVGGCRNIGTGVPGSGVSKTETREVGTFDEIGFTGGGSLEINVGKKTPLTITGDDNLLPLIHTSVQDGRLTIQPVESIEPKTPLVFTVGTADLTVFDCSGAAKAIVSGVKNETFKINLSGAGLIKATGQTGRFELSLSGAANVEADDLIAREVIADLSGAGKADVHATVILKATVSGTGIIRYQGDPKVEKSVSGIGAVKKRT